MVSHQGGFQPAWARDGKQLFYRGSEGNQAFNQWWVVDMQGGVPLSKPRLLFEKSGIGGTVPVRGWDMSLDGQKFLMVKYPERKPQPVTEMILVQNWFEELMRLAPTAKN